MCRQRSAALAWPAVLTAALGLPTADLFARGSVRSASSAPSPTPMRPAADIVNNALWYIPAGAPLNRTYTWYAPPAGYTVIAEGTPSEPRVMTLVGPDGTLRAFRLEGPVIMRVRYSSSSSRSP
jgi:hypothetical protein